MIPPSQYCLCTLTVVICDDHYTTVWVDIDRRVGGCQGDRECLCVQFEVRVVCDGYVRAELSPKRKASREDERERRYGGIVIRSCRGEGGGEGGGRESGREEGRRKE